MAEIPFEELPSQAKPCLKDLDVLAELRGGKDPVRGR